jgi:hypothetical protein
MLHHSTYRRIIEAVIEVRELEGVVSQFLTSDRMK